MTFGAIALSASLASHANATDDALQVPPRKNVLFGVQKSVQFRYASTARDGKPVYYEVDLTADDKPPRVLWLGLHFPAADAQSAQRANRLVAAITR